MIPEFLTRAEFYDIFGIFTFSYLLVLGIYLKRKIKNNKIIKDWMIWSLIFIGLIGLIIDGTIVTTLMSVLR